MYLKKQVTENDIQNIADLQQQILRILGQDLQDPNIVGTSLRVARAWAEFFNYEDDNIHSLFPEQATNHQMVVSTSIPFYTYCSHHLLPFFGHATVGYLPTERVIGISKIPRIVNIHAHKLQLQERLGRQIATTLSEVLEETELGIYVVLRARHMCQCSRGIKADGETITRFGTGEFETKSERVNEFFSLANLR